MFKKGQLPHQNENHSNQTPKASVSFWQRGQSLVEILMGLGIVSIMVGASIYSLVSVLKSSTLTEENQTAGLVGSSLMDSAITLAEGDWTQLYNLNKGSANHYFIVDSPTTTPLAVAGDESVVSANITNGLVGHWKFDETSGNTSWAYDSSGTGNLGRLYNSPTRVASTSCKVGACLGFNGSNNYVSISDSDTIEFGSNNFTIGFWAFTGSTARQAFFHWSDTSDYSFGLDYNSVGSNKLGLWASSNGTNWNIINADAGGNGIGTITFPQNQWVFVVVKREGSAWSVYQNNVLDKTISASGTIINKAYPKVIGKWFGTNQYPYNGKIDDLRIYNRALSASEISQLYNSPSYSRYFYVNNVNRTACGSGNITTNTATTCTGSANDVGEDPSTQQITAGVVWSIKGTGQNFENSEYVSRWRNSYAQQTGWSGSSGTAGPVTDFGKNYYDSSNVSLIGGGSTIISGLSITPSAPQTLAIYSGDQTAILSWTAPASNGGSNITNYRVYRGTVSGGETLLTSGGCSGLGNVLTCTETGLTDGAIYYYKVSAINGYNNEGSQSYETRAVPNTTNVWGYAWSDNLGWLSFNCGNTGTCASISYGVYINPTTGIFSGYAWSDTLGWISFNTSDLTGCPSGTCQAVATGGFSSGSFPVAVTGWAKVLSTGDFMSLSGTTGDSNAYGVQLNSNLTLSGWSWEPNNLGWVKWLDTLYNVYLNQ